jgi:hypothetical protein
MANETAGRPISARLSDADATALERLAARHDRSLSREIGRAIRFYLAHPEAATSPIPSRSRGGDDG